MKCISWNVSGLRDEQRQGIVGHYLKEWGAAVVMIQETRDSGSLPQGVGKHVTPKHGTCLASVIYRDMWLSRRLVERVG